jgi:hypothetical protein
LEGYGISILSDMRIDKIIADLRDENVWSQFYLTINCRFSRMMIGKCKWYNAVPSIDADRRIAEY